MIHLLLLSTLIPMAEMMINKIRPQRTFSPRSFMGDRGIHIDTLGKVRDTMFEDEKIIAPKPWKACKSPIVQRSYTWYDNRVNDYFLISRSLLLSNRYLYLYFKHSPLLIL